jgi:alkylation response protein AidB-like acyl-CoA dehydrogenase
MMRGLEIGRIQVASRALGVAQAALNDATRYAQERHAFGKPIWQHQSIGNYLADGATKLRAARLLTLEAAARVDAGERADMEAGMAKLFASEVCMEIARNAVRVHGGYGYSTEFDVERYFRDRRFAPHRTVRSFAYRLRSPLFAPRVRCGGATVM